MIELSNIDSTNRVADWVELYVIYEYETLSKSEIASNIRAGGREPSEIEIDSVLAELERREQLYGSTSPFKVEDNVVVPKINWRECPGYTMCLIYSMQGVKDAADGGTKLFERVASEALKSYLKGETVTIGFPASLGLKEQVVQLALKTKESLGRREPLPSDNDRGVDVVGWKPHGDNRNSQVVVLMQCAAGIHWRNKKQIPLTAWTQFIHWGFSPITGIAIPQIASLSNWNNIVDEYGFIIDRIRIFKVLYNITFSDSNLRDEVSKWCESKLQ